MIANCPTLLPAIAIADDAKLAAQISCRLARPNSYLAVIDGPRLARPDGDTGEVVRRNNAAARTNPDLIVYAGLSQEAAERMTQQLRSSRIRRVSTRSDLADLPHDKGWIKSPPLTWGRDRIGIGLLKALRGRSDIAFTDDPSPVEHVPSKSGHLVVCEQGEDLSEVIAANYAFALGAGLCLIPAVAQPVRDHILESFYDLYTQSEEQGVSPSRALEMLRMRLRDLGGDLPIPDGGSVTFITGGLPYGFAYSDVPSTHLFDYPDLGISVVNGFAAEQPGTPGIGVAVLVDPATTNAREIDAAAQILPPRGVFVRGYTGRAADVRSVQEMIELFPYDLLIIATHCGDAPGYRWTYEFKDAEGIDRTLVVDIALGIAQTDEKEMLHVTQFIRFVSLDGVDWHDPEKSQKLYVGQAMLDFQRIFQTREIGPVHKTTVPRVEGSAALKMFDNNYIALPRSLAGETTPIVINNACGSWHRLAETFTFSNARAYIGTLFPVSDSEAHDVIVKILDKHFSKPLPAALWSAQREIYGDGIRRPYVITGVYTQRLRTAQRDVPQDIARFLAEAGVGWQRRLKATEPSEENKNKIKAMRSYVEFYKRELKAFVRRNWAHSSSRRKTGS